MDIIGLAPTVEAWQIVLLGFAIPMIGYIFAFVKWFLPYVNKHKEVDRLISVNIMMETVQPILIEIDKQMQLIAKSSANNSEIQKILAEHMATMSSIMQLLQANFNFMVDSDEFNKKKLFPA